VSENETKSNTKASMAERRAALVSAAEKRAAEARERDEALELEALELDDRLASDGLERGVDYEVILFARGVFAIRRKEGILYERFKKKGDKNEHVDELNFVLACVDPADFARVNAWLDEFPHLLQKCSVSLLGLYEARGKVLAGKS
jgi:hypothetical protein